MQNFIKGARQLQSDLDSSKRGQSLQDVMKGRPEKVDEFVHTDTSNPRNVFSNLDNNPGVLYHPDSQQHVIETVQHSDLSETDRDKWVKELRRNSDPRRFGEVLGHIYREHGNTQIGRTLGRYNDEDFLNRIKKESDEMRNEEGSETDETGTSGETTNITNYNQFTDANLPLIISNPGNFAGKGLFDHLNSPQTKELAQRIQTFMSGHAGQAPAEADFNLLRDAAIAEVARLAAQTPATPGGTQGDGTPGTSPPGGGATPTPTPTPHP